MAIAGRGERKWQLSVMGNEDGMVARFGRKRDEKDLTGMRICIAEQLQLCCYILQKSDKPNLNTNPRACDVKKGNPGS